MTKTTIVTCESCGTAYAARASSDDAYLLTTTDGSCTCGGDSFREVVL